MNDPRAEHAATPDPTAATASNMPEPASTIAALADISYRGRDTGVGLARIFVESMIARGWTPPPAVDADEVHSPA